MFTVVLQLNYSTPVMISGGPLTPTYKFTQLHFHWGVNDSLGSEDLINNHRYVKYLNTYMKSYSFLFTFTFILFYMCYCPTML